MAHNLTNSPVPTSPLLQAEALARELLHVNSAAAAERVRLERGAAAARHRAACLAAAADDQRAAAENWRRRTELMAASHVPLTREEQRRQELDVFLVRSNVM